MKEQLVSIIVPVYNMAEVLNASVKTFINQTYKNIEIILTDDGSSDDSLTVMKQLAADDSRIKIYHQDNQGAAGARNTGMSYASGKYYYFPDADDRVREDTVEKLVSAIEETAADMAVCGYEWVNSRDECIKRKSYKSKSFSGKYIRENYDKFIDRDSEYGIYGSMANKLYRAEIIINNKLTVPKISKSEDEAFNILFLSNAGSVCFIEDVLYFYYMSGIVRKGEKYLKNYIESVLAFKNIQVEVAYNWNRDNQEVLEQICRTLAVNFDIYIQMLMLTIPRYKIYKRYKAVKNVVEVFNNELPSREFKPDFRKYKYLVNKKIIRLCIIEDLKVLIEIKNSAK